MGDATAIADLRRPCEHGQWRPHASDLSPANAYDCVGARPATTTDLVAALQEEGVGEVVEVESDYYDHHASDGNLVKAGRYLVVRIDGEET